MKLNRVILRYRLMFGCRNYLLTAMSTIVLACTTYVFVNVANYLGLINPLKQGNWFFIGVLCVLNVLIVVALNYCIKRLKQKKTRKCNEDSTH
jgi:hypothetical protein